MDLLIVTLVAFAALTLVGMRYVPEDTAFTVQRLGRSSRVLAPGLRFTCPVLERVSQRVRLIGHHVDVPMLETRDRHAEVYYQILEPQRTGAALERVDALVEQYANQALGELASQLNQDIQTLSSQLKAQLNHDLAQLGLRVTRCDLHPKSLA